MKIFTKLLFLILPISFNIKAQTSCLDSYNPKVNYQKSLASIMMNLSPEMQHEIAVQLKISSENDLSQVGTTKLEAMFFAHLAKSYAENKFDQVFNQMVETLLAQPQFKARITGMPEEKKQELLAMLKAGLLGEMQLRTYFGKEFTTDIWTKIANRIEKKMDDFSQWIQLNVVQKFKKIAKLSGTDVVGTKDVQFLIDGPEAFAKRDELINKARKSIHVLTWSVYDDATGIKFADQMIEKKRQGLDVKIIVDALTSQKEGHRSELIRMQQNGIEVIYSRNPKLSLSGQHRKAMIIDGEEVIAGGMNYGNVYSHLFGNDKWRDTDVYFTGSLASKTQNLFVSEWNEQIKYQSLNFSMMNKVTYKTSKDESKAILLNSSPADQMTSGSSIIKSLLALIKGAKNEIIIENAYLISSPILERTIKKAINRGVKVTIITNSSKSVDEPVISNPILASALRLKKLGANIVLKTGATLHSKVALFDGEISMIMSYNLHPRSELIEDEMAYILANTNAANQLRQALLNDIKINTQILKDEEIILSNDSLSMFINRLLYNQI